MELYHIISKGVDGRDIFTDDQDRARFVHDLYEFNDVSPAPEYARRDYVGRSTSHIRECLVDIHAWCLMKNHYHLLVSERVEGGLTLFLRKLSGYGRYFNERHERQGILLQKSKKILIDNNAHFNYIFHYIHLNPLDHMKEMEDWRIRNGNNITDAQKALQYLEQYKWSSFLDYCGKNNFPSVINKNLSKDLFPNYKGTITEYLQSIQQDSSSTNLNLE